MFHSTTRSCLLLTIVLLTVSAIARGSAFEDYQLRPALQFSLPGSHPQGTSVMDALPDGRLLVITTRANTFNPGPAELYLEDGVGTRDFRYLGDLPLSATDNVWFNPGAFLRVSPSAVGAKVAVGNSSLSVGVFDVADLVIPGAAPAIGTIAPVNIDWFAPDDSTFLSAAAWYDNRYLALGNAAFGGPAKLSIFDTQALTAELVIDGPANGANGGIGFDAAGNLFTGNGFDFSSNGETGEIRRFEAADWQDVAFGPDPPLGFTAGTILGEILSANGLLFDGDGNLLVSGGDSFGSDPSKKNFLAIAKLLPNGLIDTIRQFDPDAGSASNSYSLMLNRATGEILAFDPFGSDPRAAFVIAVPEPASAVLAIMAMLTLLRPRRR